MIKLKNGFFKNVLTIMAGTVMAQIISIAITPINSRLYTPKDFGILDLITSIVSIIASVSSLRYEQAIVIPETDEEALTLARVSILLNFAVSFVTLIVILIFSKKIASFIGNENIRYYLFIVPVLIFFSSMFATTRYFALRTKQFKFISKANVFKSLIGGSTQIALGFLKAGALGIIGGQITSALFINIGLYKKITGDSCGNLLLKWRSQKSEYNVMLRKFKDFPKYSVLGTLANSISIYGSSIFIFKIFTAEELGYLSLANRMLTIPLALIGASIADVFLQKIAEERRKTGNAISSFLKILKVLTAISFTGCIIGYFTFPYIFPVFFGAKWAQAGQYASILIFLYTIRFINSPLSSTFTVFNKQKLALIGTLIQIGLLALVIIVTATLKLKFMEYLYMYVISQSAFYAVFLYKSWMIAKKGDG